MEHDEHAGHGDQGHDHGQGQGTPVRAAKLRWTDVALWGVGAFQGLSGTCLQLSHLMATDIAAHHNYVTARRLFADAARTDLEAITADKD